MILDMNVYKSNKEFVQRKYLDYSRRGDEVSFIISMLAAVPPYTPCIIISVWIGEVCNWHPDVIQCMRSLKKYYGYENIINLPPGTPDF